MVDARFLYYQLCLPSMVKKIQDQGIGSSVPGFNLGQLRQLEVMVPPLAEQQAIAEVLGALDDKIAANATLIQTMDELATALYAERCTTEAPLSSLGRFVNGRNFTKDAAGRGRVVVRIAELNSGVGNSTVLNDVEAPDDNVARPGDVLFAWSGSLTVRRWTLPEALVNQHIFKVIPKPGLPTWLLYQATLALLPSFRGIAADKATTMGHIQRHHLDAAAPIPDETGMREIDSLMGSLWARAVIADQESQTLAELRDTLLPALMDGTIRVKDAIGKAEEVL